MLSVTADTWRVIKLITCNCRQCTGEIGDRESVSTLGESNIVLDKNFISGSEGDLVVLNKGIKAYFVLLTGGFEIWNVRGQHLCK